MLFHVFLMGKLPATVADFANFRPADIANYIETELTTSLTKSLLDVYNTLESPAMRVYFKSDQFPLPYTSSRVQDLLDKACEPGKVHVLPHDSYSEANANGRLEMSIDIDRFSGIN